MWVRIVVLFSLYEYFWNHLNRESEGERVKFKEAIKWGLLNVKMCVHECVCVLGEVRSVILIALI